MKGNEYYLSKIYLKKERWTTYAEIIKCVLEINPTRILEIGPGNKITTNILKNFGYPIETLDFDEILNPDYCVDIRKTDFSDLKHKYDLIISSQVFEHIEYIDFLKAINNLSYYSQKLLMSLPYCYYNSYFFSISFNVNLKNKHFLNITKGIKFYFRRPSNEFKEHFWEIGIQKFPFRKIKKDIKTNGWSIERRFFNNYYPYHYFFILASNNFKI